MDYEGGGGGGGAIAIPLVSGGLKDCLKGLGYGAIGTIKAIGAATVGVTVKAIASNERSKKQHAVYAVRNKGKVIYIGRTKQGVKKRFKQHIRKNRFSKKCDVVTLYDNLNYYQARGIEQIAYEYYLAKGNDMKNKIQPISPSNIKKDLYMKAGTAHIIMWDGGAVLRENE
ncbi:GIY-YIG nuclease family protein [Haloimpatiens massiliensis]|uniref:GIY-YIG nuclease family protein n=1 Tax=Haloimpatiens massiliensis TaxID=1658110 RepID=UPI001FA88C05|nr:GIY-YIG nuclease family protein [Haloimpatiens massiliensis]